MSTSSSSASSANGDSSADEQRLTVLMETEGTYPHSGGGVSTWCDALCTQLSDVDFHLVAVTGSPHEELRYDLPDNLYVHLLPTWGTEEPTEFARPDFSFLDIFRRRTDTTYDAVEEKFVPLFEDFLECVLYTADTDAVQSEVARPDGASGGPSRPANLAATAEETGQQLASVVPGRELRETVHQLYLYFQEYDYKKTFRAEATWDAFCRLVLDHYHDRPDFEQPSAFDLTIGLRWTYNFLLPLSVRVPETADVTHATLAGFSGLLSVAARAEHGIPMVITDHGIFARERYMAVAETKALSFFAQRYMMGLTLFSVCACYETADLISPVCNYNHRWERYLGADQENIETIYNGVPPDIFMPQPKPAHTRGQPTVVAAARVFPLKDIETMIRSCAVAREHVPGVQYLCYGSTDADPPYTERCEALIEELGLSDNFSLAGYHDSPAELYNEGDLSILSSVSEGFPYTVIEAMSCGRPVVATDVGGVSEALEGCGIIVPPRNPRALGEGVARLLQNDQLRGRLGRAARERVLQRFRLDDAIDAYRKVYHRLAREAAPGPAPPEQSPAETTQETPVPDRWLGPAGADESTTNGAPPEPLAPQRGYTKNVLAAYRPPQSR